MWEFLQKRWSPYLSCWDRWESARFKTFFIVLEKSAFPILQLRWEVREVSGWLLVRPCDLWEGWVTIPISHSVTKKPPMFSGLFPLTPLKVRVSFIGHKQFHVASGSIQKPCYKLASCKQKTGPKNHLQVSQIQVYSNWNQRQPYKGTVMLWWQYRAKHMELSGTGGTPVSCSGGPIMAMAEG